MFFLFNFIFALVASILDRIMGTTFTMSGINVGYGYIYLLYGLFTLLPSLAALVRRLHDIGKSGWFFLVCFIPIAGIIWLIVLLCKDSTPGPNKYGPNPKGIGNVDEFDFMSMPDANR